ncbi:formate/nitrite transporter [Enterococcus sp. PF1-24]|uniref:formate/nitrite transporter family protein n=1 Tax=unclassified Enterococcus TaxID=2608891 RepID=UPI0024750DA6|nr:MULTISPECIES: formate/nitrite transporter family protein [unclassified Enterococcus]MDH6363224.1 formate/nitrite transporter [Enterococcus sp. PFB1-1]MDH6400475.1 formate/nitrite transporter [Enterococcus sp. PF1-24]
MGSLTPKDLVDETIKRGEQKANYSFLTMAVLGIMAGIFIGVAGVAMIRTMGTMPKEWGTLVNLIGAIVFPIGLICLLLVGGELVTGNMLVVSMALFAKKITAKQWLRNMIVVTFFNLVGTLLVAYFFGYLSGTLQGNFTERTIMVAQGRVADGPLQAFLNGIACNILVCTGVYMNICAKDFIGKIFGTWLPVMAFVVAGYQHVVANMFLVAAGVFAGGVTISEYIQNIVVVWGGNLVGGGLVLGSMYFLAFKVGFGETKKELN